MSKDYKALAGEVDARAGNLFRAAPDQMRALRDLMGAASKDGALDAKTKELMAIAIAVATRCEGCIVFHVRSAIKHGGDAGRDGGDRRRRDRDGGRPGGGLRRRRAGCVRPVPGRLRWRMRAPTSSASPG